MSKNSLYTEENIRSLDWKEHIRMRPGMYIGKLGDGSSPDDGIYILLKEVCPLHLHIAMLKILMNVKPDIILFDKSFTILYA